MNVNINLSLSLYVRQSRKCIMFTASHIYIIINVNETYVNNSLLVQTYIYAIFV